MKKTLQKIIRYLANRFLPPAEPIRVDFSSTSSTTQTMIVDFSIPASMNIREARIAKGLTQKQLAKKMGTTQSSIARAERWDAKGQYTKLSLTYYRRVSDALGIRFSFGMSGLEPIIYDPTTDFIPSL